MSATPGRARDPSAAAGLDGCHVARRSPDVFRDAGRVPRAHELHGRRLEPRFAREQGAAPCRTAARNGTGSDPRGRGGGTRRCRADIRPVSAGAEPADAAAAADADGHRSTSGNRGFAIPGQRMGLLCPAAARARPALLGGAPPPGSEPQTPCRSTAREQDPPNRLHPPHPVRHSRRNGRARVAAPAAAAPVIVAILATGLVAGTGVTCSRRSPRSSASPRRPPRRHPALSADQLGAYAGDRGGQDPREGRGHPHPRGDTCRSGRGQGRRG